MRIAKNVKLNVPVNKYLPTIMDEIRQNLSRMGVDGLSVDIRYDVKNNVSMARFSFNGKLYDMVVRNQRDVRANMWAIARRVEYKVRLHLLDIEPFDIGVSPYLAVENKSEYQTPTENYKANTRHYAVLGVSEIAGSDEIKKKYRELCKAFHPDMALSNEAKVEFEKKFTEINNAYSEVCKERGI